MTDLTARVADWLDQQGYPLEMRTAAAFQAAFNVTQSLSYVDPESGKERELDLVAWASGILELAVECKSSPAKPWIVFTTANKFYAQSVLMHQIVTASLDEQWRKLWDSLEVQELPIFRQPTRMGYGATQAFTQREDVVYAALKGATKGAAARRDRYNAWNKDTHLPTDILVFPVVVVDAPLFECSLGDDSHMLLEETVRSMLALRNPQGGLSFLHLVHADALVSFVDDCAITAAALVEALRGI